LPGKDWHLPSVRRTISEQMIAAYAECAFHAILMDSIAGRPNGGDDNDKQTCFDQQLFTVKRIDSIAFQLRIREDPMQKDTDGRGINQVMKRLPPSASEAKAKKGRDQHQRYQIETCCPDAVFHRLNWRPKGKDDVAQSPMMTLLKEEDKHVHRNGGQQQVGRPSMDREDIDPSMRPKPPGAVTDGDQQPETDIRRGQNHSQQSDIRGKVKRRHSGLLAQ